MIISKILIILLFQIFGQDEPQRILFFGDSLTAGYGLSEEQAFPALVEKELNETFNGKYEVINAGLSGETSAGGKSRIDWVLQKPVDILVLELGANDGLRGLPLSQTKDNLQAIIDKARAKNQNVRVIIAGMEVPPNLGEEYASAFRKIFPALAEKNNAALIPFLLDGVAGNKQLNLPDGIHPNPEGHRIVAKNVLDVLETVL